MSAQPRIQTQRLLLRPLEPGDTPAIQFLASAPEVADTTMLIPHPYPDGAAAWFISQSTAARNRGEGFDLAITLAEEQELVGVIGCRFDPNAPTQVGYWIGVPFWGRGYATEALAGVVAHLLLDRGLARVRAFYFTRNPASGRVLAKAGFRRIGREDHLRLRDGKVEPSEVVEIAREDLDRLLDARDPRYAHRFSNPPKTPAPFNRS